MGLAYARIKLGNPRLPELAPVEVNARTETGVVHLCLPEHIARQLQLEECEKREGTSAEGSRRLIPYVGPVSVACANRRCFAGAIVMGDEPVLGTIPMEDMDLVVDLQTQRVVPNPANPNLAGSIAVGVRHPRRRL